MITVENLLDAYAIALDLWSDPELAILENGHPRENPTPEYATLIRKAVSAENAKLRELVRDMYKAFVHGACYKWCEFKEPCNYISDGRCQWYDRMSELGVEV